jgi:hypothetical protein
MAVEGKVRAKVMAACRRRAAFAGDITNDITSASRRTFDGSRNAVKWRSHAVILHAFWSAKAVGIDRKMPRNPPESLAKRPDVSRETFPRPGIKNFSP